jgi:hypothetical protein
MLLDEILPKYDFTEVHTIRIKTSPEIAFRALTDVTLEEISIIVRLLFFLRELPEKLAGRNMSSLDNHKPMLATMLDNNFTKLAENGSREIVFGLIVPGKIGRVWNKDSNLEIPIADTQEYFAFDRPDYLKVVANLLVKDTGTPGTVIIYTESRTKALSERARKSFKPYWRIIRPFSGLIRRLWLRGIKRHAKKYVSESSPVQIKRTKTGKSLLFFGGFVNLLTAAFHTLFWSVLNWKEELQSVSNDTRAILQSENIIVVSLLIYFAVISFILSKYKKTDIFARSVLLCIIGFYSIRLIAGYPLFGFSMEEVVIWIICVLLIAVYTSVLFIRQRALT